ncbi:MAG TPA: hypothetical protein VLD58_07665 [Gemmatimonadales bacterium]|nr:hypothetical protein [Gemmatimonadales bacterium]
MTQPPLPLPPQMPTSLADLTRYGDELVTAYLTARDHWAGLVDRESVLEAGRAEAKAAAIARLMAQTNPLTKNQHSATSAAAVCETDPTYAAYLAEQRDVVMNQNVAWTRAEATRLRVLLCVALIGRQEPER